MDKKHEHEWGSIKKQDVLEDGLFKSILYQECNICGIARLIYPTGYERNNK